VNLCDKANDVEQGQQAGDGEVEDYQVWTSTNTLVSETCDSILIVSMHWVFILKPI